MDTRCLPRSARAGRPSSRECTGSWRRNMPDWEQEIRNRVRGLDVGRMDDIVQELAQHLQDRYAEILGDGASESEAVKLALDELCAPHVLGRALSRVDAPHP